MDHDSCPRDGECTRRRGGAGVTRRRVSTEPRHSRQDSDPFELTSSKPPRTLRRIASGRRAMDPTAGGKLSIRGKGAMRLRLALLSIATAAPLAAQQTPTPPT